jgi:dipeptidyl aminopeptidase/acylaminoacyl peptidase
MRKSSLALSFALVVASIPLTFAQTTQSRRPMTFEDMMAMKRLGDTAVSPDGQWLAYAVTTVNLNQNTKTTELWLQKIAGGEPFKIAVTQPDDSGVQFSHDGKRILFLSGRSGSQQVWLADFDPATGATSNAKQLTRIATEADNAIWSPDGQSIVFTSAVYPDCPAITTADFATGDRCNAERDKAAVNNPVKAQIWTQLLYRHWDHFTGDKRSHLFWIAVESGRMRDLTPGNPHDVPPFSLEGGGCGCAFAPEGKELVYTDNPDPVPAISTSPRIYTLDLTNPAARPVQISTSAGGNFNPAYSPDGKYLAWRSQARAGYESDKFRLVVYDRAAKTILNVLPNFDRWVDEFAWAPNSKFIYFVAGDRGYSLVFVLNFINGRPPDYPFAFGLNLPNEPDMRGDYGDLHPLPDGERLITTKAAVESPGEINAIDTQWVGHTGATVPITNEMVSLPQPGTRQPLTHLNDALLAQLDLAPMEPFWFTAADGTKVEGFLVKPPHFDPAKKYPVKFLIHGGPQGAWDDSWSYRWNPELFAANGYVVVMVNPRGSTGYGQAFVDGVNGDWGGKPFTDLMTGLNYAEQHYPFIDKTRECALGASYGGYMANWILGHTNRFKCIVSHDGMFNAESAFGSTEELWFNTWEFKGAPWDYYGKPDYENPFRKWSPSLSAKNFKTPTLVIHSQHDYRLDLSEGLQLFTTLQLLHVPSKMLYFPDESHWVLKPQNSQLWWKTVNDWVDQWTSTTASSH